MGKQRTFGARLGVACIGHDEMLGRAPHVELFHSADIYAVFSGGRQSFVGDTNRT